MAMREKKVAQVKRSSLVKPSLGKRRPVSQVRKARRAATAHGGSWPKKKEQVLDRRKFSVWSLRVAGGRCVEAFVLPLRVEKESGGDRR